MIIYTLFFIFFRIGLFGFGGGVAMLPLIFQSLQDFALMSREEFSDLVALSQITPGPIAVNAATYVGFQLGGVGGALVATFAVALPSFILILLVMRVLDKYKESKIAEGIFQGIRPATVGLVGAAVIFIGETTLFLDTKINIIPAMMCLGSVFLAGRLKLSPIVVALVMGCIGAIWCR